MREPLSNDSVQTHLRQYVGTLLQFGLEGGDSKCLFEMCRPSFDWNSELPEQYGDLKKLFLDPQKTFYSNNIHVWDFHNPELQHVLRRFLLRQLIDEVYLPNVDYIRNTILKELSDEATKLPKRQEVIPGNYRKLNLERILIISCQLIPSLLILIFDPRARKLINREPSLEKTILLGVLGLGFVGAFLLAYFQLDIAQRQFGPKYVKLQTWLEKFSEYQDNIEEILNTLPQEESKAEMKKMM